MKRDLPVARETREEAMMLNLERVATDLTVAMTESTDLAEEAGTTLRTEFREAVEEVLREDTTTVLGTTTVPDTTMKEEEVSKETTLPEKLSHTSSNSVNSLVTTKETPMSRGKGTP